MSPPPAEPGNEPVKRPMPVPPRAPETPDGLRIEIAGLSVTGPVRSRNEDHLGWIAPGYRAWVSAPQGDDRIPPTELGGPLVAVVVADGLGGHADGHLASRFAVTTLLDRLADPEALRRLPDALRDAYLEVNARLLAAEAGQGPGGGPSPPGDDWPGAGERSRLPADGPRRPGAQTTMTALAVTGDKAWVAHVGDCRVYRLRDQILELVTTDHSQVTELLRMHLIRAEQAAAHPGRHLLTRSLGGDVALRVDVRSGELRAGDAYLLCSDGAWSNVSAAEIIAALEGDLDEGAGRLVERSIARGGDDNASVIALRVLRAGESAPADSTGGRRGLLRRALGA